MEQKKIVKYSMIAALIAILIGVIVAVVIIFGGPEDTQKNEAKVGPVWGYKCEENLCKKVKLSEVSDAVSFESCRIFCGSDIGTLWPKPSGEVKFKNDLEQIDLTKISFVYGKSNDNDKEFWSDMEERFKRQIQVKIPKNVEVGSDGKQVNVNIDYSKDSSEFTIDTDESYKISVTSATDIQVKITATSYYGARNGLETLSQLILFDDINKQLKCGADVDITDGPKFKHRGISVDTVRTFFTVDAIKKIIDGMAMVKMNTFHWHITDSHSFPLFVKSHPEFTRLGALSKDKIYHPEDIQEIVQYAKIRGVRIIPEFDGPGHIGEGWQETDLMLCFREKPFQFRGHMNPTKKELYDVLEDLYRDFVEMFGATEFFHMGGDEVIVNCWNTSMEVKQWMIDNRYEANTAGFMKLWGYYQQNALARFDKVAKKANTPIILWTSSLTDEPYLTEYINKERYIIQIWTNGDDPRVTTMLEKGYKVIVSNADSLYLDCGFASWVSSGLNWCAPYKGWQKFYDNRLEDIAGKYVKQVYGAEAGIWSEQIDEKPLESRIWPRLSALAERLWTDPETDWKVADSRMLVHYQRLVENGYKADRLQPEWCLRNQGQCPINY